MIKADKLELPNEIRSIDGKTPLQLGQNFDAIVSAFNAMKYIVDIMDLAYGSSADFEANAITYGPEEPTD